MTHAIQRLFAAAMRKQNFDIPGLRQMELNETHLKGSIPMPTMTRALHYTHELNGQTFFLALQMGDTWKIWNGPQTPHILVRTILTHAMPIPYLEHPQHFVTNLYRSKLTSTQQRRPGS